MQSGQFINHFKNSDEITTKLGLSLLYKRNPVITKSGKCYMHFYPRSYNLKYQLVNLVHKNNNFLKIIPEQVF